MNDEHSDLPAHRLWQPTTAKWFAVVPACSAAFSDHRERHNTQSESCRGAAGCRPNMVANCSRFISWTIRHIGLDLENSVIRVG